MLITRHVRSLQFSSLRKRSDIRNPFESFNILSRLEIIKFWISVKVVFKIRLGLFVLNILLSLLSISLEI